MTLAFSHIPHRPCHPFRKDSAGKILLLLLFLAAGFRLPPASARILTDPVGRKINVPKDPLRVIALAPSLTEMTFLLGEGSRLKGATRFSTIPEAARSLPRVGSYVHLDLERIVALHPDLCLAIQDGNPKYIVERLSALGIPVYVVNPLNLDGVMTTLKGIGNLLNVSARAEQIVRKMERRIDGVRSRVAQTHTRPRVLFQIGAAPMISVGSRTSIDELITLAGGINVTAGKTRYPRLTWEKVLTLQPEIVIISSMAGGHTAQWLKAIWRKWPQIPAVRRGEIHVVDSDLFNRPTPRQVDGLETLLTIIHPEVAKEGKTDHGH